MSNAIFEIRVYTIEAASFDAYREAQLNKLK